MTDRARSASWVKGGCENSVWTKRVLDAEPGDVEKQKCEKGQRSNFASTLTGTDISVDLYIVDMQVVFSLSAYLQ